MDGRVEIVFYTDDDVNGKAIKIARNRGVAILTTLEAGRAGAEDDAHFAYAIEHNYIMVTANRLDFEDLFYEWAKTGKDHPGLILIGALLNQNPRRLADSLEECFKTALSPEDFRNRLIRLK
jgi:predicted nuclease of predicted toxin-antitoxin system